MTDSNNTPVTIEGVSISKNTDIWIPYEGPREGTGWRGVNSGDIVYEDEPPGEKATVESFAEEMGVDISVVPDELADRITQGIDYYTEPEPDPPVRWRPEKQPDTPESAAEAYAQTLVNSDIDFSEEEMPRVMDNWSETFEEGFKNRSPEMVEAVDQAIEINDQNSRYTDLVEDLGIGGTVIHMDAAARSWQEGGEPQAERVGATTFIYDPPLGTRETEPQKPQPGDGSSATDVPSIIRHEEIHDIWDRVNRGFRDWFREEIPDDKDIGEDLTRYAGEERPEEVFTELLTVYTDSEYDANEFPDWVDDFASQTYNRLLENESFEKAGAWVPYEGPQGGEGWRDVMSGEVRYQESEPTDDEAPGNDVDVDEIDEDSLQEFTGLSDATYIRDNLPVTATFTAGSGEKLVGQIESADPTGYAAEFVIAATDGRRYLVEEDEMDSFIEPTPTWTPDTDEEDGMWLKQYDRVDDALGEGVIPPRPTTDMGTGGRKPDTDEFTHIGDRGIESEHIETLRNVIEAGDAGGNLSVDITATGNDVDYGPWNPEINNWFNSGQFAHVDVEMPVEDFLATQVNMLSNHRDHPEEAHKSFYGSARPDDVEKYANILQDDPGEMDMPYIEFGEDGVMQNQQEGRHRGLAARMAGIETLPVRFVINSNKKGVPADKRVDWSQDIKEKDGGEWVPYVGPQDGEGWQHTGTGEVDYSDEKPGATTEDDDTSENETTIGEDVLSEGWSLNTDSTWTSSSEFEDLPPMDTSVIDRGDGPEIVFIDTYMDDASVALVYPMDDAGEPTRFLPTDELEYVPIDEAEFLGSVEPELDEYGVPVTQTEIEVSEPDTAIARSTWRENEDGEYYETEPVIRGVPVDNLGDPFEDKDAMLDYHYSAMDILNESYDEEVVDQVRDSLEKWEDFSYSGSASIWKSAMALTGRTKLPTQFDNPEKDKIRFDGVSDEVLQSMCDVIRLSQQTAKDEFGESVTVYRGISEDTVEKYLRKNEDGSVEVRPQALESWTVDESVADNWTMQHKDSWGEQLPEPERRGVVVKMDFPTDKVGFHGAIALKKTNESFKELTMLHQKGETYTIPADQIQYMDDISKAEESDVIPELPVESSDWMRESDRTEKARIYVTDPSNVPENADVQEGPRGGVYYETDGTSEGQARFGEEPPGESEAASNNIPANATPLGEAINISPVAIDVDLENYDLPYGGAGKEQVIEQLKESYDEETVEITDDLFGLWDAYGYTDPMTVPLWDAMMEMTGEKIPEDIRGAYDEWQSMGEFETDRGIVRPTDPDALIDCIKDFSAVCRETAKENFGDSVEVYRGFNRDTWERHVQKNEDGSVTIQPQALESWTRDQRFADNYGHRSITMEVPTANVAFISELSLEAHARKFAEVTVANHGEYTIPSDKIRKGENESDESKQAIRLPVEDLDWIREATDRSEKEAILEGVTRSIRNTYNKGPEASTNELDTTLANRTQTGASVQQKQDTPIIDSAADHDVDGDSHYASSSTVRKGESEAVKHDVIKERRYVDSADDVPEGYEVQTGERGGTFWTPDPEDKPENEVDMDETEDDWSTVTDDMGYGDFEGKEILVDGEVYTASVFMAIDDEVSVEEIDEKIPVEEIDGIREGPEQEEPDPEPEPEPEQSESIDPDDWNDPPDDFNDLEAGQEIVYYDEDIDDYRTGTLSDTIYIGDDYTLISIFRDDGEVDDIRNTDVIEGVGESRGERPDPAESTSQEIIDWLPFHADNDRKEDRIRSHLQNAADSTVSEEVSRTVLDHIKAIESMPGRSHIELTAGTSQERPSLNLGTGAFQGTVNHEYAHMVADAHGYSVDREAIRRSMMEYDSEEDNFIEADPDDERFQLTQVEGKEPPAEIEQLINAVNDGWSRIQENSEQADEYTIRDNYAAINAHELLAATNETLQRTFGSQKTVETLFDKHPDLLEAYAGVFNPSDPNKQLIATIHDSNPSKSPFEANPYPDHVSKDLEENERRKGYVKVADLQKPPEIRDSTMQKVAENFEKVDDLLMEAVEKQIWKDIEDIEKAPNMWRLGDNVPQFVRSYVKQAASQAGVMYYDYSGIPHLAGLEVQKIITDSLTESDGWSIDSISKKLIDKFEGIERKQSVTIVRTEVGAVLNKARELAYEANEADPAVYWTGPDDTHTTEICTETKQEIESRGGHVKLSVLKEILTEKARKYASDGGTPERVDSFISHYNCRHTFVRAEYRFLNP